MNLFRNLLFWITLAVLGALIAQWLLTHDHGYVLIRFAGWDITTTVVKAGGIIVLAAIALWLLWKLVSAPFLGWNRYRSRQARTRLSDGLEALQQGQYAKARNLLARAAEDPRNEAVARTGAIQAAAASGNLTQAHELVTGFGDRHPKARALAQAELAVLEQTPTNALAALQAPAAQPLPPRGLVLQADALAATGQAILAWELLAALRQQQALTAAELDERQRLWAAAALREADNSNMLADFWESLPKALKSDPAVVLAYADRAARLGWDDAAARSVEQALDTQWDDGLAIAYARLPLERIDQRQASLERWLQARPGNASLLYALALSESTQGDNAASLRHLQQAVVHGGTADAWEAMGLLQIERGEDALANRSLRNALRAARGEPAILDVAAEETVEIPSASSAELDSVEERDGNGLPRLPD